MSNREEFEKWWSPQGHYAPETSAKVAAWRAWQAARTQPEQRSAGVVPEKFHVLDNHKAPKHYKSVSGDIGYINGWNGAVDAMLTAAPTAQAVQGGGVPDAYAVVDQDGNIGYTISVAKDGETDKLSEDYARTACHEHINECAGNGVEGAGQWVVRPLTIGTHPHNGEQSGEWIRCDERMPTEADGYVWICLGGSNVSNTIWSWDDVDPGEGDTHWKPTGLTRPQPPKSKEDRGHE